MLSPRSNNEGPGPENHASDEEPLRMTLNFREHSLYEGGSSDFD